MLQFIPIQHSKAFIFPSYQPSFMHFEKLILPSNCYNHVYRKLYTKIPWNLDYLCLLFQAVAARLLQDADS